MTPDGVLRALMSERSMAQLPVPKPVQLSFIEEPPITREDVVQCLSGQI